MSITTPCTNICKLNNNVCVGCGRSKEQIAKWSRMSEDERVEAMAVLHVHLIQEEQP